MLNIYQLSIFTTVVETGSFSAAAEKLHLTQPAVSLQIRSLERNLGAKLFQRNGQHMDLTDAAVELLPRAKDLISMSTRTEEAMSALRGVVRGQLVIGCSSAPGKYLLPKIAGAFKRKYSGVYPVIDILNTSGVLRKIQEREIDLGVVGSKPKDKALEFCKLFDEELVVIVPNRHNWARRSSLRPEELADMPLLLSGGNSGTALALEAGLQKHGLSLEKLDIIMEVGSSEGVALAVEAGLGISVISSLAAKRFAGKIKALQIESEHFCREVFLARNRGYAKSSAGLQFWDFIQSEEAKSLISAEIK